LALEIIALTFRCKGRALVVRQPYDLGVRMKLPAQENNNSWANVFKSSIFFKFKPRIPDFEIDPEIGNPLSLRPLPVRRAYRLKVGATSRRPEEWD